MDHDYYQILGVSPDATLDIIKAAYRKQAMQCHPDRGGTNAQMMLVNEAWEVLSNATTRHEYDELRAKRGGNTERAAFEETVKAARAKAGQYPREWAAFESWLNGITQDFENAEYGTQRLGLGGIHVATADNSISGWICVFIGGIAGAGLAYWLVQERLGINVSKLPKYVGLMIAASGYAAGSSVGVAIHKSLRRELSRKGFGTGSQPQKDSTAIVVACPQCGQKLRVPSDKGSLTVTCRKCQHKFSCN